jgi:hypothetical protein
LYLKNIVLAKNESIDDKKIDVMRTRGKKDNSPHRSL